MSRSFIWPSSPIFTYHIFYACYTLHPFHYTWFDQPYNIWWTVQILKFIIMQFPPDSCHFLSFSLSVRSKYTLQHPVLKYSQSTAFLEWRLWSFTLTQNNTQNCSILHPV
jgi:hypothetical protein